MKPKLIMMSHGYYAEELQRSAQMIVGQIDGLTAVSMLESDGLDGTKKKLRIALDEAGADVVIATDLMSGTPCNVAVQAMYERPGVRVLTGLNLPMAIEYAVSDLESADEMASLLQNVGAAAVKLVEKPQIAEEREGYED